MKKDFDLPLLDLKNNQVMEGTEKATMKTVAFICLENTDLPTTTGVEKGKKWSLMIKLFEGGVIDLKSEEITFLKELAGVALNTSGYGRFIEFLEADYKNAEKQ